VNRFPAFAPLLWLLLPTGCATPISAPSLEKRAVEAQPVLLPEAQREPDVVADPGLGARLDGILARAADGHRRFAEQQRTTEAMVRAGAGYASGSEAWTVAQQAVSALETAREPLRQAVGAVEALRTDPAGAGSGSRAAIEAAATRLAAWDGEEAQAVAALAAALR